MMNGAPQGLLYRRIIAKLGSNLLTGGGDRLNLEVMASLVGQIARLHQQSADLLVVTSGAVAAGRHALGIANRRRDIPFRQVLAAVGQSRLMHAYEQLFGAHGITVAQALVTRSDLSGRLGYLNVRNTLLALLEMKVIPIINENDVVEVEELQETTFGDNDNLSAMVANLVDADLLVVLTDTGGLYTADPHVHPEATLVPIVDRIDAEIERLAGGAGSVLGTGGMLTKLQAARLATASGVTVVIAGGAEPQALPRIASGEALGTRFTPSQTDLDSRQRWMMSGLASRGSLLIDEGAVVALKEKGRSLLPAGIKEVRGPFQRGDIVSICNPSGERIAFGISNYTSRDLEVIRGQRSARIPELLGYEYGDEAVHRNNLVVV